MLSFSTNSLRTAVATVAAVLAIGSLLSCAQDTRPPPLDRVGDTYKMRLERSSQHSQNGSSGSSTTRLTLMERVVALQPDGIVLEFDLPAEIAGKDREREWQFPARVLKRSDGSLELLNSDELEARSAAWLEWAELDPSACGAWLFTWKAVKIECDPQSAIGQIQPFDLRPSNLAEGAPYQEQGAEGPAPLEMVPQESGGAIFQAEMEVDPEIVRRQRAEWDVVVAQMIGRGASTLEEALQTRSRDRVSGTIVTEFETDAAGRVIRKTTVVRIETQLPDQIVDSRTTIQTVLREMVP